MRRSLLQLISGSFAATASTVIGAFDVINGAITNYWQTYDFLSDASGTRDRVYLSTGTLDETNLYLRLSENSAINALNLRCYSDWSTLNQSGSNECTQILTFANNRTTNWWTIANEYSLYFFFAQGTTHDTGYATKINPFLPEAFKGTAKIISATTASGEITLETNINLSGTLASKDVIQPKQSIWIVDQTVAGNPLTKAQSEIIDVISVGNNKITVSNVSGTYNSGSLVGVQPNLFGIATTENANFSNLESNFNPAADYQQTGGEAYKINGLPGKAGTDHDPHVYGWFHGFPAFASYLEETDLRDKISGFLDLWIYAPGNSSTSPGTIISSSVGYPYVQFPSPNTSNWVASVGPLQPEPHLRGELTHVLDSGSFDVGLETSFQINKVIGIAFDFETAIEFAQESIIPRETGGVSEIIFQEAEITYYQRAFDRGGTESYVYWITQGVPDPTPLPGDTTPNYTGILDSYTIVRISRN